MKKASFRPVASGLVAFFWLACAACSSLPRHTQSIAAEWLEGKDLPVSVSFSPGKQLDALSEIDLAYRLPDGKEKFLPLLREGSEFKAIIPGEQVVRGKIGYTIRARRGKDLLTVKKGSVAILTFGEARLKSEQGLRGRISFDFDREVPYYRDSRFSLAVKDLKADSRVVLATRRPGDSGYVTEFPENAQGRFDIVFDKDRLAQGYTEFYVKVTERDPDLGNVSAFLGAGDDEDSPYRLTILTRETLLPVLEGELRSSLSYSHDPSASVCYDKAVRASFSSSSSRFLKELLSDGADIVLCERAGGGDWSEAPLAARGSSLDAVIRARDIEAGVDQFYFKLSAATEEYPLVEATLPAAGARAPFTLQPLSREETRQRVVSEIKNSMSASAPASVRETEGFAVTATLSPPGSGFFMKEASIEDIDLALYVVSPGTAAARGRPMSRSGNAYSCSLGPEDTAPGDNGYFIQVSAQTNSPLGRVEFAYPGSGPSSWKYLKVVGLEELRLSAADQLRARLSHKPPEEVDGSAALPVSLKLGGAVPEARAYLLYKRPEDKKYLVKEMERQGDSYIARLSPAERKSGYTQYYFLFSERDPELGFIEVEFPKGGEADPYQYLAAKDGAAGKLRELK